MSEKLGKVIQKQELFTKKDALLVGVSGGLDSMVLCHLLYTNGFSFIIAHCNYHLRGIDSDLDEKLVRDWALERSVPFYIKSCDLRNEHNIQEQARNLRYAYFKELQKSENCKFILTGHHGNDQIETFFINLSRGAGLNGLKGIVPYTDAIIRPFLGISKAELSHFAAKHHITYREDQSNQSNKYLRNFFRNEIISRINQRIPSFFKMCIRSIDHLSELSTLVDHVYSEWKSKHVFEDSEGIKIDKPGIETFYLISKYLIELGFHPETIHQLKINYTKSGKLFMDKNNHKLLLDRKSILIHKTDSKILPNSIELNENTGELNFANHTIKWNSTLELKETIAYSSTNLEALFDLNKIKIPLILRKWLPGDTIQPFGMKGKTKKVQDVLTNKKISVFDKEQIYLLISDNKVLWIPGIMRSDIAIIDKQTVSVFQISLDSKAMNS